MMMMLMMRGGEENEEEKDEDTLEEKPNNPNLKGGEQLRNYLISFGIKDIREQQKHTQTQTVWRPGAGSGPEFVRMQL